MRLIITRPEPDAARLARHLEIFDIEALCMPLLEIQHRQNVSLISGPIQAVLATSANGVRALTGHSDFRRLKPLPIFTVGDASAAQALAFGFGEVHSASGDLAALHALVVEKLNPEDGPLLYVTGSKIAGDLAGLLTRDGFEVVRAVLYDAIAVSSLSDELIEAVKRAQVDGVILMSPRAAKIWAVCLLDASLERIFAKLRYFCLSPAVRTALQAGLKVDDLQITVADEPTQNALVEGILAEKGS